MNHDSSKMSSSSPFGPHASDVLDVRAGAVSAETALLWCIVIDTIFVVSLYLSRGDRNAPHIVKKRMLSSTVCCLLSWIPVWMCLRSIKHESPSMGDVLSILGLRSPDTIRPAIGPLLHVIVLYAGPILFEFGIQRRDFGPIEAPRDSLLALRTLLFAPVVEEFVFRSCMAPLFIMAGWSKRGVVAVTPLMFGAAHLHHLHNLVTYEGETLRDAGLKVLAQFGYTTVFGMYATSLFMSFGSIIAPVIAHMLCNFMGFPRFGAMARHENAPLALTVTVTGVVGFFLAWPQVMR